MTLALLVGVAVCLVVAVMAATGYFIDRSAARHEASRTARSPEN
jgi:hypothetical protein